MKQLSAVLLFCCCAFMATAQYCEPTFTNGCFNWTNEVIVIGDIDWSREATDCALSDYTDLSTPITPGVPTPMLVTNGHWCGCAVWVDLNNDQSFDASENLYHTYVGGDPTYDYSFNLTIPDGTPAGSYRMRVIAGWGSDGVTVGANGYGPCGAYQYGNFDDFTLEVESSGITEKSADQLTLGPNPTTGLVTINGHVDRVRISAIDGRDLGELRARTDGASTTIDLGAYGNGAYLLTTYVGAMRHTDRVVKN